MREDKGKRKEKRGRDDELLDRYGLGEQVRMDLVRADEDKKEGSRADWLSNNDRKEVKYHAEDGEEWEAAQTKRRRLQLEDTHRKSAIKAETGWQEPSSRPSTIRSSSASSTSLIKAPASRKVAATSASSTAVSRLAGQLRLNSARKADPFLSTSSLSSSLSSTLAGSLVRNSSKK